MFPSTTIIRELALNLAKVIFMLKQSVKLVHLLVSELYTKINIGN